MLNIFALFGNTSLTSDKLAFGNAKLFFRFTLCLTLSTVLCLALSGSLGRAYDGKVELFLLKVGACHLDADGVAQLVAVVATSAHEAVVAWCRPVL